MSNKEDEYQEREAAEATSERGRAAEKAGDREVGRVTQPAAGRGGEALERRSAAGAEGVRQAGRTVRETASRTAAWIEQSADELEDTGERIADTGTRTATAAVSASQRAAGHGRDILLTGTRAAAGMSGRIGSVVRAFDIYREAGETSSRHVHALVDSWLSLGRGIQQMQHTALQLFDRAAGQARHRPQDLLRVNSLEELAEVQRGLYLDAVNYAFDCSTRLLELATSGALAAIRPLESAKGAPGTPPER
jgi:hypothetical protein